MRSTFSRLLFVAFAAAAADATFALRGAWLAGASLGSAIAAFVVAAGVVACPLVVVAAAIAASSGAFRGVVHDARRALATLAGGNVDLAATAIVVALGAAATRASMLGRAIASKTSAHLAAAAIVIVSITACALAVAIAIAASRAIAPRLASLEARAPGARLVTRGFVPRAIATIAAAATLEALVPGSFVVAPAAALFAWLVASTDAPARLARLEDRGRARAFVVALLALTLAAPHAVARLPGRARSSVVEQPPYGALVLAAARRLVDRDGDGYSPILGGGDCDDRDASVHPGARDVPGNGRDENCSGADADDRRAFAPPPPASLPHAPERPSFVVLLLDALRPDHLGFAGYARPTSPNLDRFRRSATWFRRTYSPAPTTRFALAALFTGLDLAQIPEEHTRGGDITLAPDARTLAEALDDEGYDRAGFPIPYVAAHMNGMGQGFRVWEPLSSDTMTSDAAAAYLERTTRPFLLYAHYFCAHSPYERRADHEFGPTENDAYDSAVATCDAEVGRVLDAIDGRADRDRIVVVVLSDHGELLGEHGLDRHGTSLIEPAVRSLLLARIPGTEPRVIDSPVTLSDIAPTLVALARARPAAEWSLVPYLLGASFPERPMFLLADGTRDGVRFEARGVVVGRRKLVRDLMSGAEALFDLDDDPGELRNLRRAAAADAAQLSSLVDAR